MKFENEKLGCSFEIPEKISVRQQMTYWGDVGLTTDEPPLIRRWEAGKKLIQCWQCEGLPDPTVSLDEIYDPEQTSIVLWASAQIWKYIDHLESVPKN